MSILHPPTCRTCGQSPGFGLTPICLGCRLAGDFYGPAKVPAEPTDARPGSEAKIEIMTQRAGRLEQCFHPGDAVGSQTIRTRRRRVPA